MESTPRPRYDGERWTETFEERLAKPMTPGIATDDLMTWAMLGGQLLLVLGGLFFILQQRQLGAQFYAAGIVLVVGATAVPGLAANAAGTRMSGVAWQWVAALIALVAAVFRQWGAAVALAAPLIVTLLVWPDLSGLAFVAFVVLGR